MTMLTLHAGRAFPPLRGGAKGGVNPRASSSTPEHVTIRSPHPHSLPAGAGGACMKRAPCLHPLRGGMKGGVTRVQMLRRTRVPLPALPTLIPSPLGRDAGRARHDGCDLPANPVNRQGGSS